MKIITPYSLLLGLLVSGSGLYQAFSDSSVDVVPALMHFIVASLVAGVGLAVLSTLVSAYADGQGRRTPLESSADDADGAAGEDRTIVMSPEQNAGNLVAS